MAICLMNFAYCLNFVLVSIAPEMQKRIDAVRAELAEGKTIHFPDAQSAIKWMYEL